MHSSWIFYYPRDA